MSGSGVSRRDFLHIVGLGGTTIALGGCGNTSIESGVELVESYVQPENFVVPGVGVYYASTCTQCASACGIMGGSGKDGYSNWKATRNRPSVVGKFAVWVRRRYSSITVRTD